MPKGPRNLVLDFGAEGLTHYGGAYLIHRFLSRIGLKRALAQTVQVEQRNTRYSLGETRLALLYPMILGLERIETTQLLRQNGVFQYLMGLRAYPDPSTLRRFLLRVAPMALPPLRLLHDRFLARMTARSHPPSRLIFDIDSTVLVVYGKQEQARIGATTRSSEAGRRTTRCSVARGSARTSGMASCGPAMPMPPADARLAHSVFRGEATGGPADDCPRRQRVFRSCLDRMARRASNPLRDTAAPPTS